ncbi:hypothetical protein [Jatrophihabitans sp.]|nr:hypothetical protein [Jatrophihabitans sp.]
MPSSLLTAVFGLLLVIATVIGIISTTNDDSQRPSGSQNRSGVVLYGGR